MTPPDDGLPKKGGSPSDKAPVDLTAGPAAQALASGRRVMRLEAAGIVAAAEALGADFAHAVDLLAGLSGRVIVTGMGKSGHVARKVAAGAAERVPFVQVTNLARTLRGLQDRGVWIVGTTGGVDADIYDVDFKGAIALVMGAEGEGMRRLTMEHCDQLVRIPMAGEIESLNVSVAAGVCLYEAVRQRRR